MNEHVTQAPAKPAELIEEYIALRDRRDEAESAFKDWVRTNALDRMEEIENQLLDVLNQMGVDSIAGKSGTAYKNLTTSVTTADPREFRRHVIGEENWDLADWRPNKTAVNELVARGEPLPPGINRTATFKVGIRRKT